MRPRPLPTVEEGARALTRGGLEIEGVTNLGAGFSGVVVARGRREAAASAGRQADARRRDHRARRRRDAGRVRRAERARRRAARCCGRRSARSCPERRLTLAREAGQGHRVARHAVRRGRARARARITPASSCSTRTIAPRSARRRSARSASTTGVLEVNAPANRGDVLGHLGVARELCAMLRGKLVAARRGSVARTRAARRRALELAIATAGAVPRYTARVDRGRDASAPSPRRIAQRLRAVGVRPISNLVDVTNYVMFELGQPLHAFDAAKLTSGVDRRRPPRRMARSSPRSTASSARSSPAIS